jgi:hypothetical protein
MRYALAATLTLFALAATASAEDMTPFVIPFGANPDSPLALKAAPIAPDGPRIVVKDGKFAADGRRVRVWGVNLCFSACVPPHEKADEMAARLAAAGVNSVRFHHMDSSPWPRGLLDPKDRLKIVPEALDRLDYLVDQLARRGITSNINLHVGREASTALGLPKPNTSYDKIVGIFTPALVDAQKQYARDLLGHVNPYRKVRYADDAAVAFVEITNEDSLFMWSAAADLPALPPYYADILRGQYAAWLKARYGTTQNLRTAWSKDAVPLGENMLASPVGTKPAANDAAGWVLEQHAGCAMTVAPVEGGEGAVRIMIQKSDATSWHLSVKHRPLKLAEGAYYTLRFRARSDQPRAVGYSVGLDVDPWTNLGLSATARLTPQWQDFRAGFVAKAATDAGRLAFSLGGSDVPLELAGVTLCPGGREGLREGEAIEGATVALFAPSETDVRGLDRLRFLAQTERGYFDGMREFLRKDLGVKSLVTGTIVFGPLGLYGQGGMDFIDGHSYWQHPRFPRRPWDSGDWTVEQKAMVDLPEGSTLPRLAAERLDGKPFTVSEYNHPAPNDFQAETVPMLAAFAAAQDWDGIWLFTYSHDSGAPADAMQSYFNIEQNPAKWGFMRAGTAVFRDFAVPPLGRTFSLSLGGWEGKHLDELAGLHRRFDRDMTAAANSLMAVPWTYLLQGRLAVAIEGHSGTVDNEVEVEPELTWTVEDGRGTFTASGPGARVVVTHAGGTDAAKVARPPFAAVTVTALDGKPLEKSAAILVTACGRSENTGMGFSEDRRTVGRNWGKAPVMIEPVTATVALPPGSWTCRALGPDGLPRGEVTLKKSGDAAVLPLDPSHKTMWYLLTPAK